GVWTLTLPGGRNLTVDIEPVPTHECDHRNETHGYEPSDKLRHLVQVGDGSCTFPPCPAMLADLLEGEAPGEDLGGVLGAGGGTGGRGAKDVADQGAAGADGLA